MSTIDAVTPLGVAVTEAIQKGDRESLHRLLSEKPELATARIRDECEAEASRTLLHLAADWPGDYPNGPAIVAALVEAGADVNAPFIGQHAETPLHWAASSDNVGLLDALIDAGADIEAPGSVLGGGTAMADAVGFGQWQAARRLLERGARTTLWQAAALGLLDRIEAQFREPTPPTPDEITAAFWQACHGGHRQTAEYLLDREAELNWVGWNDRTPLDIAEAQGNAEIVAWLRSRGGRASSELHS